MPITKSYLRYVSNGMLSLIASRASPIILHYYMTSHSIPTLVAIVAGLENIIVWDIKLACIKYTFQGDKHVATALTKHNNILASGYSDGAIRVWDLVSGQLLTTYNGHKSAVTVLKFDLNGERLVSGSKDTDIILWNVVDECGLYRLKGHKGPITSFCFSDKYDDCLISCGKDGLVKIWDLTTKHCFQTLVGHRAEVLGLCTINNGDLLVTSSADGQLRLFAISSNGIEHSSVTMDTESWTQLLGSQALPGVKRRSTYSNDNNNNNTNNNNNSSNNNNNNNNDDDDGDDCLDREIPLEEGAPIKVEYIGTVDRKGLGKISLIQTDSKGLILVVLGAKSDLEVFSIRSQVDLIKLKKKRLKNSRKRAKLEENAKNQFGVESVLVSDLIVSQKLFKASHKLSNFSLINSPISDELYIGLTLTNNCIEIRSLANYELQMTHEISVIGHHNDIRCLSFSSDSELLASGSADQLKVWRVGTSQCIGTLDCCYSLCCLFAPGDRCILLGGRSGELCLFDIHSNQLIEMFQPHSDAIMSMCMRPDLGGVATGSSDKSIKLFDFELVAMDGTDRKRLSLQEIMSFTTPDNVLALKYSPDHKLISAALLDNTVKIYYADTMKFFISLYGHSLPVLCIDISHDSALIITGSADKTIKIWGLDFGDCHRSLLAHEDNIMSVMFIPESHQFVSASKDKQLKLWNADNFEYIVTLSGHQDEIWCISCSPDGRIIASASHDMSIRLWKRTDQLVFPSEEREEEREVAHEAALTNSLQLTSAIRAGETDEVGRPTRSNLQSITDAERLMEAIELWRLDKPSAQTDGHNPLLRELNIRTMDAQVLNTLRKIPSSEIEESLLVLPFSFICDLLILLSDWLRQELSVELCSRCTFHLIRLHHQQIVASKILVGQFENLKNNAIFAITQLKDKMGYNIAGLNVLERSLDEKQKEIFAQPFFDSSAKKFKKKKRMIQFSSNQIDDIV